MAAAPPGLCCCRRRSLAPPAPAAPRAPLPADVASASSFQLFRLRHFHLGLELRPEERELAGELVLELRALQAAPPALVLDSHPALSIQAVRCRRGAARDQPLPRFPRGPPARTGPQGPGASPRGAQGPAASPRGAQGPAAPSWGGPGAAAPSTGAQEPAAPSWGDPGAAAPPRSAQEPAAPSWGAHGPAATSRGAQEPAAASRGGPGPVAPSRGAHGPAAPSRGAPELAAPSRGCPGPAVPSGAPPDPAAPFRGAQNTDARSWSASGSDTPSRDPLNSFAPATGALDTAAPSWGLPDAAAPSMGLPDAAAPSRALLDLPDPSRGAPDPVLTSWATHSSPVPSSGFYPTADTYCPSAVLSPVSGSYCPSAATSESHCHSADRYCPTSTLSSNSFPLSAPADSSRDVCPSSTLSGTSYHSSPPTSNSCPSPAPFCPSPGRCCPSPSTFLSPPLHVVAQPAGFMSSGSSSPRSHTSPDCTPLSIPSTVSTPLSAPFVDGVPSSPPASDHLGAMAADTLYYPFTSDPTACASDWPGATVSDPVDANSHSSSSCPLPFRVEAFTDYGSALIISVPAALQPHEPFQVIIQYTASDGPAIWWLDPELTYGNAKLFMFTQGHSVCNRSFFPCFDTPAVKSTYSATVKAPAGIQVLMSATHSTYLQDEGIYHFQMDYPVPAYLVALTAGDLVPADIGPRSRVWAEPCLLQTATSKLSGLVERWLSAAEELYGPYIWGRYDIVFLPPSFPIVAMENPCLTFIISSILESDEFLIIDVIHEIAHSWFGNAVTNATWEEMWLSEGLATYAQRRITTETYGASFTCLETAFRLDALHRQMKLLGDDTPVSKLQVKLEPGVNPSNLMNLFTYEKGYCFVYYLSQLCGDLQRFDAFLRAYIEKFKFTSVVAQDLLHSFLSFFPELRERCVDNLQGLEFERWLNATGPPLVEPDLSQGCNLTKPVEALSLLWTSESLDYSAAHSVDITKWRTFQIVLFLDRLLDRSPLSHEIMLKLSQCYSSLLDSMNAEIRIRWLQIVVRNNYYPDLYKVRRFLENQMSRMYTIPLYEDLGTSTLKPFALEVFYQTQHRLHPNLRKTIQQILAQGVNPTPSCSDSAMFSFSSDSSTMVLSDQTPEPTTGAISLRDVNVSA